MPSSSPFLEFARNYLPSPPARVLDVGCGQGELTTALAVEGYEMLGIDPLAPQGDLFRRIRLEDLDESWVDALPCGPVGKPLETPGGRR